MSTIDIFELVQNLIFPNSVWNNCWDTSDIPVMWWVWIVGYAKALIKEDVKMFRPEMIMSEYFKYDFVAFFSGNFWNEVPLLMKLGCTNLITKQNNSLYCDGTLVHHVQRNSKSKRQQEKSWSWFEGIRKVFLRQSSEGLNS